MALGLMDIVCSFADFSKLIAEGKFNSVSYNKGDYYICWYQQSTADLLYGSNVDIYFLEGGSGEFIDDVKAVCEAHKVSFSDYTESKSSKINRLGEGLFENIEDGKVYYFSSAIAVALSLNKHKGLTEVDFSLSPYWAVTENDDRQVVMVQGLTKQELDNYNV